MPRVGREHPDSDQVDDAQPGGDGKPNRALEGHGEVLLTAIVLRQLRARVARVAGAGRDRTYRGPYGPQLVLKTIPVTRLVPPPLRLRSVCTPTGPLVYPFIVLPPAGRGSSPAWSPPRRGPARSRCRTDRTRPWSCAPRASSPCALVRRP